jgi:transposase-like protein
MGNEGSTVTEIAVNIGVARSTIYEWKKNHPEFSDALIRAYEAALAYHEKELRKGFWGGREFNDRAMKIALYNQFRNDYKPEAQLNGSSESATDQLEELAALVIK